jgi:hypothetical protein
VCVFQIPQKNSPERRTNTRDVGDSLSARNVKDP